jgi:hypothetical protein
MAYPRPDKRFGAPSTDSADTDDGDARGGKTIESLNAEKRF